MNHCGIGVIRLGPSLDAGSDSYIRERVTVCVRRALLMVWATSQAASRVRCFVLNLIIANSRTVLVAFIFSDMGSWHFALGRVRAALSFFWLFLRIQPACVSFRES